MTVRNVLVWNVRGSSCNCLRVAEQVQVLPIFLGTEKHCHPAPTGRGFHERLGNRQSVVRSYGTYAASWVSFAKHRQVSGRRPAAEEDDLLKGREEDPAEENQRFQTGGSSLLSERC